MADIRNDKSELLHYDNPDFQVFYRKNYIPGGCIFPNMSIHWHDEVEFLYVTEGHIGYQLNGRYVTMDAGEGIFVNARQLHLIKNEGVDCVLYCLIFHPMILSSSKHVASEFVKTIIENDCFPYILLSDRIAWQNKILHHIKEIHQYEGSGNDLDRNCDRKPGHELDTLSLLYKIWSELYHNLDIAHTDGTEHNQDLAIVKNMIGFIHENYKTAINLNSLCEAGNVGKTKCTALFTNFLNLSPMEYVNSYRLDKSLALLEDTDLTVTRIACETGFSDSSYFAKAFRKYIGCSPQEYRKFIKEKRNEDETHEA